MDQGLTTSQVMQILSVKDPDTIYAMHKAGKIHGGRIGREYRFSRQSVEAFLRGDVPATPAVPVKRKKSQPTSGGSIRQMLDDAQRVLSKRASA